MAGEVGAGALSIALLTGGSDKPYALGLASALAAQGVAIEFVGSDELNSPEVHAIAGLRFFNLRGSQREDAGILAKVLRVAKYYGRLVSFVATTRTRTLHILWNNRFEVLDRTALMAYYRLLGKRVVLTAHNVNAAARDGRDNWFNRTTLRIQYRLSDHVFVHTDQMRRDLMSGFGVAGHRVTVIPFGLNDTIPKSDLTPEQAKQKFGLSGRDRTLLFFGRIAPYKGLEHLIHAVAMLAGTADEVRLIIGGRVERGHGAVLASYPTDHRTQRHRTSRRSTDWVHPGRGSRTVLQGCRRRRPAVRPHLSDWRAVSGVQLRRARHRK